jgi:hypothetical protein
MLLLGALVRIVGSCTTQEIARAERDPALAGRIEHIVETVLTSDDDAKNASVLSEARVIFEREGIPSQAKIGDAAAYGFVLINMLGQPSDLRRQFLARLQEEASSQALPQDALAFAEARRRQTEVEERYRTHTPSHPELRDQISRLLKEDQAVRARGGFDLRKMEEADRRTAGPLRAIFDRYGVPTYEMVGVPGWNKTHAAVLLGLTRDAIRYRIEKLSPLDERGCISPMTADFELLFSTVTGSSAVNTPRQRVITVRSVS